MAYFKIAILFIKKKMHTFQIVVSACFSFYLNLLDVCDTFFQKDNAFCFYCYLCRQYVGNSMEDQ